MWQFYSVDYGYQCFAADKYEYIVHSKVLNQLDEEQMGWCCSVTTRVCVCVDYIGYLCQITRTDVNTS